MIPIEEHYRAHKIERANKAQGFEWQRTASAVNRARRIERIARRRARRLDRASLAFATVSGWTGQVARRLHARAATRRVNAC